jgi:hypothetical protein
MLWARLLFVAVITFGWAALLLVAVFAGGTVCGVFVDFDLGGFPFVAGIATQFFTMSLVIECHVSLAVFIGHGIGCVGQGKGEGYEHQGNSYSLHRSLLDCWLNKISEC